MIVKAGDTPKSIQSIASSLSYLLFFFLSDLFCSIEIVMYKKGDIIIMMETKERIRTQK